MTPPDPTTQTPRTEIKLIAGAFIIQTGQTAGELVPADFARTLERSLLAAEAENERLKEEIAKNKAIYEETVRILERAAITAGDNAKAERAYSDEVSQRMIALSKELAQLRTTKPEMFL